MRDTIRHVNAIDQLWAVAKRRGPVDARRLLAALERVDAEDVARSDERSKMLVSDATDALRQFYGPAKFASSIGRSRLDLSRIPPLSPDSRHFCLRGSIVDATDPQTMFELLRELGDRVRTPSRIVIGGSLSLMVDELIVRETNDIDVVDELPDVLRNEHDLLRSLTQRYRLRLAHFQSHYLNDGWRARIRSLGVFGSITAFRVDPIDVLVGKLFSARTKDLDDVRLALPLVDRATFVDRVATTTARWRADERLRKAAESNWYVISGEATLPAAR